MSLRLRVVFPVVFVFGLALTAPAHAQFGTNLIVNGDAESGAGSPGGSVVPVPGWSTIGNFTVVQYGAGGGFPLATDPGPSDRGLNFFAGGPSNASSGAEQLIDVSSAAALIDTGAVTFSLSGYLGGFANQPDNAVFTTIFQGTGGVVLGSASIGPVTSADRGNVTAFLLRNIDGFIPAGTKTISAQLSMTRFAGIENDGYADNLSLVLSAPRQTAAPEPGTGLLLVGGALPLLGLVAHRRKT